MEMRRGGDASPLAASPLFKLAGSPPGYLGSPGLLATVAGRPAIKQEPSAASPEPAGGLRRPQEDWLPSPNQTSLDASSPFGVMPPMGAQTAAGFSVSPMSTSSYDPYSPTGRPGQSALPPPPTPPPPTGRSGQSLLYSPTGRPGQSLLSPPPHHHHPPRPPADQVSQQSR